MKYTGASRSSHATAAAIAILLALVASDIANAEVGKEPFKGSCEDLNDFIRRAGVTDAGSQNHPRSAAWTTFEVTSAPYHFSSKAGQKDGQVCLEGALTEIPRMFSVTHRVTRLEWQPFGSITKECAAEKARWEKATEERERQRLEAVQTIVEKYNEAWSAAPHRYQGCAENEALAQAKLGQLAEKDIREKTEKIKAEMLGLSDRSAVSSPNDNTGLDCSKCLQR